jgi:antitoxin MazE
MKVSRWGNSLAIRLPAAVVEALELKAGDGVEVHVVGDRAFGIDRDRSRERALARIRAPRQAASRGLEIRSRGVERPVRAMPSEFSRHQRFYLRLHDRPACGDRLSGFAKLRQEVTVGLADPAFCPDRQR